MASVGDPTVPDDSTGTVGVGGGGMADIVSMAERGVGRAFFFVIADNTVGNCHVNVS